MARGEDELILWAALAGAGAGLAYYVLREGGPGLPLTAKLQRLGVRLTNGETDPIRAAEQASAKLGRLVATDAYALARMIRSERGSGPQVERLAVAHVALNDAKEHGWSLLHTLVGPRGHFGPQRGWRYATTRDPYESDLELAETVLAGSTRDPTGGAVKFVHINAFGKQEGTRTYEEVRDKWAREGLRPATVAGASSDFRVFRRTT